jgi:hypothetical protein
MPEFVIERELPGVGELSAFQQGQAVRRSCSILHGVDREVRWVRSYITDDKVYCVFEAPSEQVLRDLISQWDLPPPLNIAKVSEVLTPQSVS